MTCISTVIHRARDVLKQHRTTHSHKAVRGQALDSAMVKVCVCLSVMSAYLLSDTTMPSPCFLVRIPQLDVDGGQALKVTD